MADHRRSIAMSHLSTLMWACLIVASLWLSFSYTARAHIGTSHCGSVIATCYNWPSPRVLLTYSTTCKVVEKAGYTGNNPPLPVPPNSSAYQPWVNSMSSGNQFNYSGCGGYFCQPRGTPNGWYLDTKLTPGWIYGWRNKKGPSHASFVSSKLIDSCNCGGGCPPADDSLFKWISIPAQVLPGERFAVSVRFRNTGTSNWTVAGGYKIRTSDINRTRWGLSSRDILVSGTVAPATGHTFITMATAPLTAGSHTMESWQTHKNPLFGDSSPATSILVNTPATGLHEVTNCSALTGWAQDPDSPASTIPVRIYRDGPMGGSGVFVGIVPANEPHAIVNGHGYSWTPLTNAPHTYYLYARDPQEGAWYQLPSTPTGSLSCFTLTMSATPSSIPYDSTSSIDWTVSNPVGVTCTASDGGPSWPGAKGPNGPELSDPLTSNTTFTLSCSNSDMSLVKNVSVSVAAPPDPVITSEQFCTAFGGTIFWTYSGSQEDYRLQVASLSSFSSASVHFDSDWVNSPAMSGNAQDLAIGPGNTYYARVKVRDIAMTESGWSGTWTFDHPPRVGIDLDPNTPIEAQPFDAIDVSNYGPLAPSFQQWDFGDGSPLQSGSPVTHTYATSGTQTITLTVRDTNYPSSPECSDSTTLNINRPIPGFKEVLPQ